MSFDTGIENNKSSNQTHDLRKGNKPFNLTEANPLQGKPRRSVMGLRL
jgi:hypothetical protein